MVDAGVRFSLSPFRRGGFVEGHGKLVVLHTDDSPDEALVAMAAAALEVNQAGWAANADDVFFELGGAVPTPHGPACPVNECEPAKALPLMLDQLARQLKARGVSGELRPAKAVSHPLFDRVAFDALGAFLILPVDYGRLMSSYDPYVRGPLDAGWLVDDQGGVDVTRRVVTPLLDWVLEVGGPVYVRAGTTQFHVEPAGVLDYVMAALPHDPVISVTQTPDKHVLRQVEFSPYGGINVASYGPTQSREHHFALLARLLQLTSPFLAAGFLREASTRGGDRIRTLAMREPRVPLSQELKPSPWRTTHLEQDYVYDAFVAQVMTTSQLDETGGLPSARWQISALDPGHHLVVHAQPELWLDHDPTPLVDRVPPGVVQPIVPAAVLDQARIDFGPAIMTPSTLSRFPPRVPTDPGE